MKAEVENLFATMGKKFNGKIKTSDDAHPLNLSQYLRDRQS